MNTGKFRYVILFFLFFIMGSCTDDKEEDDGWNICIECDIESWLGVYNGTTSHYNATSNRTVENLDIEIKIEETATDYFTVYIKVPEQNYSATLSGDFINPYSISFASSSKSVSATMYVKENQIRLSGNSKKFAVQSDTVILKEVVNFDVYK